MKSLWWPQGKEWRDTCIWKTADCRHVRERSGKSWEAWEDGEGLNVHYCFLNKKTPSEASSCGSQDQKKQEEVVPCTGSLTEGLLAAARFTQCRGDMRLINGREICSGILNMGKWYPTLNVPEPQRLGSERLSGERIYILVINSYSFSMYLFWVAVRDVCADLTALYACMFSCSSVLAVVISLQQQQDYRDVWKSKINFSLCGFLHCSS